MMRAVDCERFDTGDAVQQRAGLDADIVTRLVARVWLAVRQRPGDLVRDMLDQCPAEHDIE
jgi:hypothetical protein